MDGQTDGQTDDPITRCPWQTFMAGGIKIEKSGQKIYKVNLSIQDVFETFENM